MKHHLIFLIFPLALAIHADGGADSRENPAIDMEGYLAVSMAAAKHRQTRRLSEAEFIRMSREPGTIVLDARSRQKFDELHIKGALNLSFPDRSTRVLIYCNNNFRDAEEPFPSKLPSASLNLSTYIALYNYGYRNVYELAPLLDIKTSALEFATSRQPVKAR